MVQTQGSAITDEVWAGIGERTGRLRTRTAVIVAAIAVALLAIGAALEILDRYAALAPRVELGNFGWDGSFILPDATVIPAVNPEVSDHAIAWILLTNTGWADEWILGVAVEGAGIEFIGSRVRGGYQTGPDSWGSGMRAVSPTGPFLLSAGATQEFGIDVRITDCRAVGDPPVAVTVRDWRGVRNVQAPMTRVRHLGSGWAVTTPDDPLGVSGLRYLADKVCDGQNTR